ncbi:hypothetical protein [Nitrosopumilus sp. Nsub]|nr:hypothetical protein [Nitrosopumilus sp. Nsub]
MISFVVKISKSSLKIAFCSADIPPDGPFSPGGPGGPLGPAGPTGP